MWPGGVWAPVSNFDSKALFDLRNTIYRIRATRWLTGQIWKNSGYTGGTTLSISVLGCFLGLLNVSEENVLGCWDVLYSCVETVCALGIVCLLSPERLSETKGAKHLRHECAEKTYSQVC